MNTKKHYSGYNCVLLATYNCLRSVSQLNFDFCLLGLPENYFQLFVYESGLTNGLPHEAVQGFLAKIDGEMHFPDTQSPEGAIDFANRKLKNGEVLAAAINLRYSVLDPTDFDSDNWNFQLITDLEDNNSYRMFDMFHGKHYQVDDTYLKTMIDTPFNYRHTGCFSPFMQIALLNPMVSQRALDAITPHEHLYNVLQAYDLPQKLSIVEPFMELLKARGRCNHEKGELYNEIYRLMGSQMIIIKGRQQLVSSLMQHSFHLPVGMQELPERWNQLSHLIPMTLGRKDAGEYERFQEKLFELFHFEHAVIQQTLLLNDPTTMPTSSDESGRKLRTV